MATTYQGDYFRPSMMTPVRVAPPAEFSGQYRAGQNGVGDTFTIGTVAMDGVTVQVNDRVLLMSQATTPSQNGIYIVTSADASNIVLTRSYDFQSPDQARPGNFCTIMAGTANKGKIAVVVEPQAQKIGTDAITFALA